MKRFCILFFLASNASIGMTQTIFVCKDAGGQVSANQTGCSTGSVCKDSTGNWTKEQCKKLDEKRKAERIEASKPLPRWEPEIGMTAREVLQKTRSQAYDISPKWWGGPKNVNTTKTASGTHEQWVFGNGWYLYFDNDVLTSIQE